MDPNRERKLGLRIDRESLAEAAREPVEDSRGAGFGGAYPGPIEQSPEAPLIGERRTPNRPAEDAGGGPVSSTPEARETTPFPEPEPWPSEAWHDFRKEPGGYDELAEGSAAPSRERAGRPRRAILRRR